MPTDLDTGIFAPACSGVGGRSALCDSVGNPLSVYPPFYAVLGDAAALRRLMSNCGERGRSRNLMLVPNLLPKAVPHDGPRLLPGLIVRTCGRLVAGAPSLLRAQEEARPSRPAY